MGFADLEAADIITGQSDKALWIVEERGWPGEHEALEYAQLIIKLAWVQEHARRLRGEGCRSTILVHSPGEPPVSVLQFLRGHDVAATVGSTAAPRPATGRRARIPNLHDGSPDLAVLLGANAAAFAKAHDLDGSVESLARVDDMVAERRAAHGLVADAVEEKFIDGDLIVPAGAYAGEVLRANSRGGLWWLGPAGHSDPLHLRIGLGHGTRVNVLGTVRRHLSHGARHSLFTQVDAALARLV